MIGKTNVSAMILEYGPEIFETVIYNVVNC